MLLGYFFHNDIRVPQGTVTELRVQETKRETGEGSDVWKHREG